MNICGVLLLNSNNQQGKNNLDFFICFYLGLYHHRTKKDADFIIITGDKYFDPLIASMNILGRKCKRVDKEDIAKGNIKPEISDEYRFLIEKIKSIPVRQRPQKPKTLLNALNTFSQVKYDEKAIQILIELGVIKMNNTRIVYNI